jgi:hypothetical protein
MPGNHDGGTKVTVSGPADAIQHQAALAELCAAVERAVRAYRPAGVRVREIVVMLEEGPVPVPAPDTVPVYVDVYDSGYGHGI